MALLNKELPAKLAEYRKAEADDMPYPPLLMLAGDLVNMMEEELIHEGLLDEN